MTKYLILHHVAVSTEKVNFTEVYSKSLPLLFSIVTTLTQILLPEGTIAHTIEQNETKETKCFEFR